MKISSNVLCIPLDDSLILYHNLSKEMIQLDCTEQDIIDDKVDAEVLHYLKENIYVTEGPEDYRQYINMRNKVKYNDKILSFIIHTNYTCNLACSYCYQNNIKNNLRMNEKDTENIINFINNQINRSNPEIVELVFIGGEPLLEMERICVLLNGINIKEGIKYNKSIITNGVLLNEKVIVFLKKWDFNFLQITLDGDKNSHDIFRKFHTGKGSFDIIFENIKKFNKEIPIVLNVNLNKENKNNINDLLDKIKKNDVLVDLVFSLVFEIDGYRFPQTLSYKDLTWLNIHKLAINEGYSFAPFYRNTDFVCGLYKQNEFVISPDAKLYKCISGVGESDYLVSHVKDVDSLDYHVKMSSFIEQDYFRQECKDCALKVHCGLQCNYLKKLDRCYKNDIISNDIELIKYIFTQGDQNV